MERSAIDVQKVNDDKDDGSTELWRRLLSHISEKGLGLSLLGNRSDIP